MKCIICNFESKDIICDNCLSSEDIRFKIYEYWLKKLIYDHNKKDIFDALCNKLKGSDKDYVTFLSNLTNLYVIGKEKETWLIENVSLFLDNDAYSKREKNQVLATLLHLYLTNYEYDKAEKIANMLIDEEVLDEGIYLVLGEFFLVTRRYNKANIFLKDALELASNSITIKKIRSKMKDCKDRENGIKGGYLPKAWEDKQKYQEFMKSIDIDIKLPKSRTRPFIKNINERKSIEVIRDGGFKSFVAFDLETTGLNSYQDAIVEIAAIKVVDGVIKETKNFLFQELVHPYKCRIPKKVEDITGITNEMVANCRNIKEVLPDFLDFVGDNILLGYNCVFFDSKFLTRASQICNIDINNKYFDVMWYVPKFKSMLHYENKTLNHIAGLLDIVNPKAHRALADAITTAKVYLKLLELEEKEYVEN